MCAFLLANLRHKNLRRNFKLVIFGKLEFFLPSDLNLGSERVAGGAGGAAPRSLTTCHERNTPIRGGCQGGDRLPKTHCSNTTQSLQVGLERWFKKKSALNVKDQEVKELCLVSLQNTNS